MKKTCKWCKCDFEPTHGLQRFCSPECRRMARRKRDFERSVRLTTERRELGLSCAEQRARRACGAMGTSRPTKWERKPRAKTYAEIKAHNRANPIAAGWRGQAVTGGW